MKKLFFILFTLCTSPVFSQTKYPSRERKPLIFLDSNKVETLGFFDPQKIENINVVNDKDPAAPNGKIYITSKKTTTLHFLSAADILRINKIPAESISIFIVDNDVIMDTADIRIDSSYILKVEVIKGSEIKYLPGKIPDLNILKIFTATKENIEKQKRIRIRGDLTSR